MNRSSCPRLLFALLLAAIFLVGCGEEKPKPYAGPTYHRDVVPLLQKHCIGCHQPGGVGPFALDNYETAKLYAALIAEETSARRMPPFNVDNSGACNEYQHARWLADEEIGTFAAWAKGGAVQGSVVDIEDATPVPLELDHVSVTLDFGKDYTPNKDLEDDYRCFVIDPGISSKKHVTGYAVRPGQTEDVHHMILYQAATTAASLEAEQKNAATGGTGYPCFGAAGVEAGSVAGWAPGSSVTRYPEGTGIAIEPDRKLIMQIHYHPHGTPKPDRTQVDLQLEDQIAYPMFIVGMANFLLNLRPGEEEVETSATLSLAQTVPLGGINLLGVFPHMHKLGRKLRVEIEDGLDGDQCLVDVPQWNFDWQQLFIYKEPIRIKNMGNLRLTCTYDTTDRTEYVRWGEGTEDEMCINFFFVTAPYAF